MKKTVSLILGSGGARGLAHIGVIRELEERGYQVASIVGCSTRFAPRLRFRGSLRPSSSTAVRWSMADC